MNINQDKTRYSKKSLELPKPNLDKITLSHNRRNTFIIPDFLKQAVNEVLSLLRIKYTRSSDQPNQAN